MSVIGGPPSFDRVKGLREVLTATGAGIYLATHVSGPIPAEAMTAVHESDDMELRLGRVGPDRDEDLEQREKEARAVAAAAIKGSPERMALAHGAADAARMVALELLAAAPTDARRVLLIDGLDRGVGETVRQVAAALGATTDELPALPAIVPTDVALVCVAHVDRDGRLADVGAIAEATHRAEARLLLDAGRSAGALDFEVDELGADIVIADTHRWLLGPDAVAMVWVSSASSDELPGRIREDAGPFGRGALLALARSVGWLLMYVELPWAIARTEELADRLHADLAAIEGVELIADDAAHGAIVSMRISDWDAEQAVEELSRGVFAIVEADVEADLIRASVGAWNRESELDRFIKRVAELAAHTPVTLPRKPSLTILSGPLEPEGDA